jgi:thiamine biosynthesis protein ThiS
MKLTLNGEPYETTAETVGALLDELKIQQGRVAVEVNLVIVKRAEFDHTGLPKAMPWRLSILSAADNVAVGFRLYLITGPGSFPAFDALYAAVESALKGGVTAVQLREKSLPIRDYMQRAERMRELTSRYGAKLFVNDRIDIAVAVEADGVHLGRRRFRRMRQKTCRNGSWSVYQRMVKLRRGVQLQRG